MTTGWRGVMQVGLIPGACREHWRQPLFIQRFPSESLRLRESRLAADLAVLVEICGRPSAKEPPQNNLNN